MGWHRDGVARSLDEQAAEARTRVREKLGVKIEALLTPHRHHRGASLGNSRLSQSRDVSLSLPPFAAAASRAPRHGTETSLTGL